MTTMVPDAHFGKYRILRLLGQGGMADVYEAEEQSVGRVVALKVLPLAFARDQERAGRFAKEIKASAALDHPNIVSVFDVGQVDELHYYTMSVLRGGDLKARLKNGALPEADALRITKEIAAALSYAHEHGFVHRDVKPENILFREDGSAVLTDFGIARATGSGTRMTATGLSIGTPHYMSPEQARGREVDGRSDLYALGVVFYEMLTGRVPFEAQDSFAVGLMHISDAPPALPSELARYQPVLDRLLAKDPDDRYQHGAELVADLERLAQGEKIAAAPNRTRLLRQAKAPASVSLPPSNKNNRQGLIWGIGGAFLAFSVLVTGVLIKLVPNDNLKLTEDNQQRLLTPYDTRTTKQETETRQVLNSLDKLPIDQSPAPSLNYVLSTPASWTDQSPIFAATLAISRDGTQLATAGSSTIDIWATQTGENLANIRSANMVFDGGDSIFSLLFSPSGRALISAGSDNRVRIWDTSLGRALRTTETRAILTALAMSKDGSLIAYAGDRFGDGGPFVEVRDVASGGVIETFPINKRTSRQSLYRIPFLEFVGSDTVAWVDGSNVVLQAIGATEKSRLVSGVGLWVGQEEGLLMIRRQENQYLRFSLDEARFELTELGELRVKEHSSVSFNAELDQIVLGSESGQIEVLDFASGQSHHDLTCGDLPIRKAVLSQNSTVLVALPGRNYSDWQAPCLWRLQSS